MRVEAVGFSPNPVELRSPAVAFAELKEKLEDSGGEDSDDTVIPMSPVNQFLAHMLRYPVDERKKSGRIPWPSVGTGLFLVVVSIVAIFVDLQLLGTVDGLSHFIDSSAMVGENILRGAGSWIHDQTTAMKVGLNAAYGDSQQFDKKLQSYSVGMPDLSYYKQQMVDGKIEAAPGLQPMMSELNNTVHDINSHLHVIITRIMPVVKLVEQKVRDYEQEYKAQLHQWAKFFQTQAMELVEESAGLAPAVSESLHAIRKFSDTVERAVGMDLDLDPQCLTKAEDAVSTPKVAVEKVAKILIGNLTKSVENKLDITTYIDSVFKEVNEKADMLERLGNNVTQTTKDLQLLLQKNPSLTPEERQLRSEAADRLIATVADMQKTIVKLTDATQKPLSAVIAKLNQTADDLDSFSHIFGKAADELAVYPAEVNHDFTRQIFRKKNVWQWHLIMALALLVAAASTVASGFYLANFEKNVQEIVEDEEALSLLCAFHNHVSELDFTCRQRSCRPFQRTWLRTKFMWLHTRQLIIFFAVAYVVDMIAAVGLGLSVLNEIEMLVVVAIMGKPCFRLKPPILIDDASCTPVWSGLSDLLGREIIPGGSCSSAGLLVCSEFFMPMKNMLVLEVLLTVMAIIGLIVIASVLPSELRTCFTHVVEDVVTTELEGSVSWKKSARVKDP
eukprot:CAMPEP_0197705646 /NCGR_PEP_ID=MMETSP1338-20131121/126549_1 /TAXON_ID=43686 ORGANISM="Pelagodinium beii, Strain RCC1491" /NCGR_SAMPLE_ID=MMETSP1338 /ASSEMBLY_ACC=CAM_ASM_000754 /LENGTH=672 /DNA_ID=CAMNT_0043289555 /DNA_START=1 /DNA_END=2019 /DNA_ORIENTATION=-